MLPVLRARLPPLILLFVAGGTLSCGSSQGVAVADAATDVETEADAARPTDDADADADAARPTDDAERQLPPLGGQALRDWLSAGHYKSWHCESQIMSARPNGAHGRNRVCSNELMSLHAGEAPFPVGAAAVKELYGGGTTITGYAVSRKTKAGTDGNAWFWAEGSLEGTGLGLCATCHAQAPTFGGHDFVYVRVGP